MFTINQNLIDDFADKINEKEKKNNKVTSLSSSSTHVQYPSAKAVYDNLSLVDSDYNEFQIIFSTSSGGSNTFTSGTTSPFTFTGKILIDWGDGNESTYDGTGSTQLRHTYSESGEYTITFKGNISKLNDNFVSGRSGVVGVKFSSTITSLGQNAFYNTKLTSVRMPLTLTSTDGGTFGRCTTLSNIEIPSTMTSLSGGLFRGCTGLTKLKIPEGVKTSGSSCFRDCTNLKTIEIPSTMESMSYSTFQDCTSLESVRFNGEIPPTLSSSSNAPFWGNVPTTCKIIVPSSKMDVYKNANNYPDPDVYEYIGWADYVSLENTYKETIFKPFNASMWQDVDGGTQTVSTTSSTVYNSGVNRQAMIDEFTDSDKYVLEFDFITTVRTRVGLLFGVDETQTRNGYVLATDIQNTWVDNDSTSTTVAEMDSNKFLQNTTQHIKFVRDGNIARIWLDNELMYTITDMNNHYNRIGLWKWGGGTITLSNFVLKTPQNCVDKIITYADLNDYTTTGFYYCPSIANSLTLTNNPTSDAFSLLVEKNGVGDGVKQTYTTYHANKHRTYVRTMYTDTWTDPSNPTNVWGSWQLYFQDTGWQNISFSRGYQNYSSTTPVRYRRIGKIVHLEGKFKNNSATTPGQNGAVFGNITDSTCLPTYEQHSLQQGSGANKFILAIQPNGQLYWGRYGTTTVSTQAEAGAWLHCYATWFVD